MLSIVQVIYNSHLEIHSLCLTRSTLKFYNLFKTIFNASYFYFTLGNCISFKGNELVFYTRREIKSYWPAGDEGWC